VTFVVRIWLRNLGLIASITTDPRVTVGAKLRFLWSSLGAVTTAISPAQVVLLGVIAVLFGLNLALALRTLVARRRTAASAGVTGMFPGLLGIGCSACGSVLLSALLGTGTTAALVRTLPLGGLEFSIAGILVLIMSLLFAARRAEAAPHCRPPRAWDHMRARLP
jgi:hypothetical protein